ncbi:MAG TPA: hypothetical protein VJL87_06080, partial [Bdellovibrionota bacterium]|nr:hypothetical protein [Bdellovibrionota bacterium]
RHSVAGWDDLVRAVRSLNVSQAELRAIERAVENFDESLYLRHFDLHGKMIHPVTGDATREIFRRSTQPLSFSELRLFLDRPFEELSEILFEMERHTDLNRASLQRTKSWLKHLEDAYGDSLPRVFRYLRSEDAAKSLSFNPSIQRAHQITLDPKRFERFYTPEELQYFKREFQYRWNEIEDWIEANRYRLENKLEKVSEKLRPKPRHDLFRVFDFKDIDAARKEQKLFLMLIRKIDAGIPVGKITFSQKVIKSLSNAQIRKSLGEMTLAEAFYIRRPWIMQDNNLRSLGWMRPYLMDDAVQTFTDFRRGLVWTIKHKYKAVMGVTATVGTFVLALTAAQPLAQLYVGSRVKRMAMGLAQEQYRHALDRLEDGGGGHDLSQCPYCHPLGNASPIVGHNVTRDWDSLTDLWLSLYTNYASEVTDEMATGRYYMTGLIVHFLSIRTMLVSNQILDHVIKLRLGWEPDQNEKRKMLSNLNEIFSSNQWVVQYTLLYPLIYPKSAKFIEASLYHCGFQHFLHTHNDLGRQQYETIRRFLVEVVKEEQEIVALAQQAGLKVEKVPGNDVYEESGENPVEALKLKEQGISIDLTGPEYFSYRVTFEDYRNVDEWWNKIRGNHTVIEILERIEALNGRYDKFVENIAQQALKSVREQRALIELKISEDSPNVEDAFKERFDPGEDYWERLGQEIEGSIGNSENLKSILAQHDRKVEEVVSLLQIRLDSLIELNRHDREEFIKLRSDYDQKLLQILDSLSDRSSNQKLISDHLSQILNELENAVLDRTVIKDHLAKILDRIEDGLPSELEGVIKEAQEKLQEEHAEIKTMIKELQEKVEELREKLGSD